MIKKLINAIVYHTKNAFYYAKHAIGACKDTVVQMNSKPSTKRVVQVSYMAYLSFIGSVNRLNLALSIYAAEFLFRSRENYIKRLGDRVIGRLSVEERALLDNKIKLIEEEEKLENEYAQKFSDTLKPEFQKYMDELRITTPPFYRVTRGNNTLYILGTLHTIPFDKLPDFIKTQIQNLLKTPNIVVASELGPEAVQYKQNSNQPKAENALAVPRLSLKESCTQLFVAIKNLMVLLYTMSRSISLMLKPFVSPMVILKAIIRPALFSDKLDSQVAYFFYNERVNAYNTSRLFGFLKSFSDFMSPGLGLLWYKSIEEMEDNKPIKDLLPHHIGMDCYIPTMYSKEILALETSGDRSLSDNLNGFAKLKYHSLSELFRIVIDMQSNDLSELKAEVEKMKLKFLEETRKQYKKMLDCYSTGNILQLYQECNFDIKDVALTDKEAALKKKIVELGIVQDSEAALITRNLNWYPKIQTMLKKHNLSFIFVGAGHLGSATGLLNLLAQDGFQVEKMVDTDKYIPEPSLSEIKERAEFSAQTYLPLMNQEAILYYHNQAKGAYRKTSCCGTKKPIIKELPITRNHKVKMS